MIVAFEMEGLNDTRPFLLTWHYGDFGYSLNIEKNITRAQLEEGWAVEQRGNKFLVTLEQMEGEVKEDETDHRYWQVTIFDVNNSTEAKKLGGGAVSQSEFLSSIDEVHSHLPCGNTPGRHLRGEHRLT